MNQSMWDHEMFYADRSARNEQHLLRQLWKIRNVNMGGSWKLECLFCFVGITCELLHKWISFSKRWLAYLQALFESLINSLNVLNMWAVWNIIEVKLGQTPNHSV
jgi:hypothetical protein